MRINDKIKAITEEEKELQDRIHREAEALRQREAAERAAAQKALDEPRRKPEPAGGGTLPATASAFPLIHRMATAGLDETASRKSYREIEKQNPFLNAVGLADKCKEGGIQLSPCEYRYLMERCITEGSKLDGDTWTYLENQRPERVVPVSYVYDRRSKQITEVQHNRLLDDDHGPVGNWLNDKARRYEGSTQQKVVDKTSALVGTVVGGAVKGAALFMSGAKTVEDLDSYSKVYDETAAAMEGLPEMKRLHERYSILGTWTDADNLHPDKSLIDREIIEYHQKIKELEALPTTDSRRSAIGFYQEALDSKYEIKHSGRFAQGMVEGGKLSAEYMAEGYLGGVLFRVLRLGYLGVRGHQVYEAGKTLPYVLRGSNAGRIAKPLMDTLRIPSEVTGLARQLQQATKSLGSKLQYTKGQGYQIVIPNGKKEIMVRIMDKGGQQSQPYWRVSVEGKGAFDMTGKIETIPELTHHPLTENSLSQITRILRQNGIIK